MRLFSRPIHVVVVFGAAMASSILRPPPEATWNNLPVKPVQVEGVRISIRLNQATSHQTIKYPWLVIFGYSPRWNCTPSTLSAQFHKTVWSGSCNRGKAIPRDGFRQGRRQKAPRIGHRRLWRCLGDEEARPAVSGTRGRNRRCRQSIHNSTPAWRPKLFRVPGCSCPWRASTTASVEDNVQRTSGLLKHLLVNQTATRRTRKRHSPTWSEPSGHADFYQGSVQSLALSGERGNKSLEENHPKKTRKHSTRTNSPRLRFCLIDDRRSAGRGRCRSAVILLKQTAPQGMILRWDRAFGPFTK
jgi:hypothetical protein